ncbi:MAG: transporter substrate-binding domain-containing protein [Stackebrandtia sp.]
MPDDLAAIAADLAPTGRLRASINLGNPVLAQGTPESPGGVTVDIARELGERLSLPVEFVCFTAARDSFAAMTTGDADLCFLAVDPARAAEIAFTAPYVVIEGVYAVPEDSPIRSITDVDRDGVRVGVKNGSAYDLYLSRTLDHATVVRGAEGTEVFLDGKLDVAAGIRQPMTAFVDSHPGHRLIGERFMGIEQAVGTAHDRRSATVEFLRGFVTELCGNGFVAESLRRSGHGELAG